MKSRWPLGVAIVMVAAAPAMARKPTPADKIAAADPRNAAVAVPVKQIDGMINIYDYPREAKSAKEEGKVGGEFVVGADGAVKSCSVMESSGSASLDRGTCVLIVQRYRFKPAQDAAGNPVEEVRPFTVHWNLPEL